MEPHRDTCTLALHRRDAQPLTHGFEGSVLQKVFYRGRWSPKAVFQLLADVLLLRFRGNGRNSLILAQPKNLARYVILRDAHVKTQVERGAQVRSDFFALQFRNGALQHLAVHIETDRFYVAVLLPSEHVAGAAQFQVQRRDTESRA